MDIHVYVTAAALEENCCGMCLWLHAGVKSVLRQHHQPASTLSVEACGGGMLGFQWHTFWPGKELKGKGHSWGISPCQPCPALLFTPHTCESHTLSSCFAVMVIIDPKHQAHVCGGPGHPDSVAPEAGRPHAPSGALQATAQLGSHTGARADPGSNCSQHAVSDHYAGPAAQGECTRLPA